VSLSFPSIRRMRASVAAPVREEQQRRVGGVTLLATLMAPHSTAGQHSQTTQQNAYVDIGKACRDTGPTPFSRVLSSGRLGFIQAVVGQKEGGRRSRTVEIEDSEGRAEVAEDGAEEAARLRADERDGRLVRVAVRVPLTRRLQATLRHHHHLARNKRDSPSLSTSMSSGTGTGAAGGIT
jgi:hypothetical protein